MTNTMIITIIAVAVASIIAYLLGSVNFAIIVTKIVSHDDIRNHGSGNAGMTNVLRTLGKGPALVTLLGDFSKGILSVLIYRLAMTYLLHLSFPVGDYIVAFTALLGHLFPIFYGFKGGKGILVSFGAIVILAPLSALTCLIGFIIVVAISKYISLGSIVAAVIFPTSIAVFGAIQGRLDWIEVACALPIAFLVIFMHRQNIIRLINHSENKLSFKSKKNG